MRVADCGAGLTDKSGLGNVTRIGIVYVVQVIHLNESMLSIELVHKCAIFSIFNQIQIVEFFSMHKLKYFLD